MCLYMLLKSDTRSKGTHAVKQIVGFFTVSSKIWRVESPVETGTHIHCLCMMLISAIIQGHTVSLKKGTKGVEESVAEEVLVPKRKLELVFKMYFLYIKVYFNFVFHTFMGVYYIPVVCITYTHPY